MPLGRSDTIPHPLAVVSGASGTIGGAVARHLWEAGYSLLCLGRNAEKLLALYTWAESTKRADQYLSLMAMDIQAPGEKWEHLQTMIQHCQEVSPLVLLAVCHGAAPRPCSVFGAHAATREVFEVDVMGTLRLIQGVGQYLAQQHSGSIALVASVHAHATYPERVPYSVTKSAICGLMRAAAVELGPAGVRVNAILPWQVAGSRSDAVAAQEFQATGTDTLELYRQRAPLRRLVTPEDIARTVLWLAQTESVTGQEITLDCGVSASLWHKPFLETPEYSESPVAQSKT